MSYQLSKNSPRVIDYFLIVSAYDHFESLSEECSESAPCEILLKPAIVDRYPVQDRPDAAFPDGIVLFCFPAGFSIQNTPMTPSFHSFVHTSEQGERILGCCLKIYEKMTDTQCSNFSEAFPSVDKEVFAKEGPYYVPKCICVTSKWPYVSPIKKALCQLYRLSLHPSKIPVERIICNLVDDVPAPPAGLVDVVFYMGSEKIEEEEIKFSCPSQNQPNVWTGLPIAPLFECLAAENVLVVFSALLVERQIVFVSSQYTLLTTCAEAITSLLYPFSWSHVYVPILPKTLLGMLSAPVPYVVGVHQTFLSDPSASFASVEAVFVYLDDNHVTFGLTNQFPHLAPPPLPERRGRKLLKVLQTHGSPLFDNRSKRWKTVRLPMYDAAYRMVVAPDMVSGEDTEGQVAGEGELMHFQDELELRKGFLNFFVGVLLNYRRSLVYPEYAVADTNPTVGGINSWEGFRFEEFLEEQSADALPLMEQLVKTQAFAQFITERISLPELLLKNVSSIGGDHYGTVFDCVYFDECLDAKLNRYALRRYNLSGGHIETPFIDNRATKHVKTFVPPPPDIQDLPTTDDGESVNYVYESFPRMREQLFSAPREQQPLERAWKQVAQATLFTRLKRTKNMQGLEGVGAAGTVLSAVFSSFLTVLCTSIAATANLSATESPNCRQSEERSTETVATPAVGKETIAQKAAIGGCPSSRLCYCKKCHDIIPTAMRVVVEVFNTLIARDELPSDDVFRSLASACGAAGDATCGVSLLVFLQQEEIAPDFIILAAVAQSLINHNKKIERLIADFRRTNDVHATDLGAKRRNGLAHEGVPTTPDNQQRGRYSTVEDVIRSLHRNNRLNPTNIWIGSEERSSKEGSTMWELLLKQVVREEELFQYASNKIYVEELTRAVTANNVVASEYGYAHLSLNRRKQKLHILSCRPSCEKGKKRNAEDTRDLISTPLSVLRTPLSGWGTPRMRSGSLDSEEGSVAGHGVSRKLPFKFMSSGSSKSLTNRVFGYLHQSNRSAPPSIHKQMPSPSVSRSPLKYLGDVATGHSSAIRRIPLTADLQWSWQVEERRQTEQSQSTSTKRKSFYDAALLSIFMTPIKEKDEDEQESPDAEELPRARRNSTFQTLLNEGGTWLNSSHDLLQRGTSFISSFGTVNYPMPFAASKRLQMRIFQSEEFILQSFPNLTISFNKGKGFCCKQEFCMRSHTVEQIQIGWDRDGNNYSTNCSYCGHPFVPMFNVSCSQKNNVWKALRLWENGSAAASSDDQSLWCPMLSPWVLMKEIQSVVCMDGIHTLMSQQYNSQKPQNAIIFWNLIVMFRRFGLPTSALLTNNSLCTAFVENYHLFYSEIAKYQRKPKKDTSSTHGASTTGKSNPFPLLDLNFDS